MFCFYQSECGFNSHSIIRPIIICAEPMVMSSNSVLPINTDLKLVLQLLIVFQYYGRTISQDVCDLLGSKLALLPEEQHHMFYCLHRHSQDLGKMGDHSLKTA